MLKVFEAFSGIGSQTQALKNIGIEHEVVATAEIDKYAIMSYAAVHHDLTEVEFERDKKWKEKVTKKLSQKGIKAPRSYKKLALLEKADEVSNNLGDISKIQPEDIPDHDLFTYSFPCQDISVAGNQKGLSEDADTRSSLLWQCRKVIKHKKPKYLLLENVKNLVGKNHKDNFDKWLGWLESQGYSNYWKVLNAKDYGIPQNRERVFVVSILDDEKYDFPEEKQLTKKLKDMLDRNVDESYYLSESQQKNYNREFGSKGKIYDTETEYTQTLAAAMGSGGGNTPCIKVDRIGRIFDKNFVSKKYEKFIEKNEYFPKMFNPYNTREIGDVAPTQTTQCGSTTSSATVLKNDMLGIRKLTPKECWRLMGFKDEQFNKAQKVNSDSQLYKQAGNSIVVNVLEEIFKKLTKVER